jgi:hypothetical protein
MKTKRIFCVRVLFCFVRNKVKEVIELTLSHNKNKSKQKAISGQRKVVNRCHRRKRLRKDGKATQKSCSTGIFIAKADIVYCIYFKRH